MQSIKNDWKTCFDKFSPAHQDYAANLIISELKDLGLVNQANDIVLMTNAEISAWLQA